MQRSAALEPVAIEVLHPDPVQPCLDVHGAKKRVSDVLLSLMLQVEAKRPINLSVRNKCLLAIRQSASFVEVAIARCVLPSIDRPSRKKTIHNTRTTSELCAVQ